MKEINFSKKKNKVRQFYFRGPLFLRPTDVAHEPTRLFYRNEVIKEITRQITGSLDQIVAGETGTGSTKCAVMNAKSYVSSRLTEIDERDCFVCESKYSQVTRAFRKGTKVSFICAFSYVFYFLLV